MRVCEPCSMCCIIPEAQQIGKPAHTPCRHLQEGRCSIYEIRPNQCAKYRCLWVQGQFEEDERPDKIGVICSHLEIRNVRDIIVVELQDDDRIPERFLNRLMQEGHVLQIIKTDGSYYFKGKPDVIETFIRDARSVA